jgi:HlyD family secretion protein
MSTEKNRKKSRRGLVWLIVILVIAAVVVGGFIINRNRAASAAATQYQTSLAAKGTLTATVGATGTVRSNQSTMVMWQATGTIGSIKVNTGDMVKAGDLLASLTFPAQTQSTLESNLLTAQENLAEMTSPVAIANAKLAITSAESDVINAQTDLNNQQYWQNDSLIQNYYANYVIAKAALDKAENAYDKLNVGGYINNANEANAYQALYNAQQNYNTANYYYSLYSQAPTKRQMDEAQATLDLAKAKLKDAQDYLTTLTTGDIPEGATGAALLQYKQAQLAVQNARASLDAANLTAPFAGTITEVDGMAGDQVTPGTTAFRLDDLSQMKVDVQVSEVDINSVQVGQPVTLTFDAISGKTYNGKVVEVAQTGDVVSGAVNFTVTVVLTDPDASVKPGMTAAVTITVQQLSDVLLVPNRAVRLVSDQRVVYILKNGLPEKVDVTLGASSDSSSEVISGDLKVGDEIILNPPSTLFNGPPGGSGNRPFGGGN